MSLFYENKIEGYDQGLKPKPFIIAITCVLGFVLLTVVWMGLHPIYRVWSAQKHGEAEFAQAEQNRNIVILEAQASNEAATSQAEARIKIATAQATAEIERAKGVAEANKIIGDSLKGNEDYLRYLYITGIAEHGGQIIYIPTEAGLPILEAGKR